MHILLLAIVAIGYTFVVVLGVRSVVADLLALARHRPPSMFDAFAEEDPDSDDEESEDRNRPATSPYARDTQASSSTSQAPARRQRTEPGCDGLNRLIV
jgi:hypothetical protein